MPQGRGSTRPAKGRRRKARPVRTGTTVWHGTSDTLGLTIAAKGLQPRDGIGPFVTTDKERAAGYAVRAVCADLVEMGAEDQPDRAPRALLIEARVDPERLRPDDAHEGDFVILGGCPGDTLRFLPFDPRPYLPGPEGIREYARLMGVARAIEPTRVWLHGGSTDAAA